MFDVINVIESIETTIQLTLQQAEQLRVLGRELRGKENFYQIKTNNINPEDHVESDEESDRTVIRCRLLESGSYRVRVANAIGAVALPGLMLHVLPKIPMKHFVHVARNSYPVARYSQKNVSVDSLDLFWELVAQWCVSAVEQLIRFGLLIDYQERNENLSHVRGRIDISRSSSNFLSGRLEVNCDYDELDLDHPINRVLRAAVHQIAGDDTIANTDLRQRAARLDRMMEGIGPFRRTDLEVRLDRRTIRYSEAHDLSCRILGLFGTNVYSGGQFGRTFLVPTPDLIEQGLRTILASSLSPITVTKVGKRMESASYFTINPDLVFANGLVTGDIKYKLAGINWNRNDVQQAATFATGYCSKAALLATFSQSLDVGDLFMQLGDLEINRVVWDARPDAEPSDSEALFLDKVSIFINRYLHEASLV